jgi:hypothetical protein
MNSTTLEMNVCRAWLLLTMSEYFWPPSPQPPTESISFDLGLSSRNRMKSS